MSVQRLHAFEKTAIQARHTIKRLEVLVDSNRISDKEKTVATALLNLFKDVRAIIPPEFVDVDLKEKE
jgi:hypothetical protein